MTEPMTRAEAAQVRVRLAAHHARHRPADPDCLLCAAARLPAPPTPDPGQVRLRALASATARAREELTVVLDLVHRDPDAATVAALESVAGTDPGTVLDQLVSQQATHHARLTEAEGRLTRIAGEFNRLLAELPNAKGGAHRASIARVLDRISAAWHGRDNTGGDIAALYTDRP